MPQIVVLTGAGISAESGVPTFRDADGLWEGHRVEDVATPEGFDRDRATVQRFYDERRAALRTVEPNAAHRALAELEETLGEGLLVVTQNIDDLHERAGSRNVIHMHGELLKAMCRSCGAVVPWEGTLADEPVCPKCGAADLRPDVVWFGEVPYEMDRISDALADAALFVSVGTSGAVYPAAGFVQHARRHGARTLELNLEPSEGSHFFHESRQGRAGELVPAWVREVFWG
ncbi:NAD-dependent protein deacylase [Pimelobacter simplex]|uniref:NAD-dependent protein deacylase n=1 Tax=Nocardioides simplex TaxID=2045 RepID=A0A0A1DKT4_NOCSI|nr:Sir2 family NAD+-dependent deacetylase [Pimelobacter simplex]AIY15965.1 NAD-dependent protein deacetylase of SIR2 family [Pimelobacter simplex]MCG8150942.1 NAD-dependent protein deacylase [Pimelobacter simplex]GEB12425.1 NAD-dependent protein deacylase [Pimelobacter simplex]SFM95223.1 NAD-dependent deacetylase [Pimelobacter simplex]